MRHSAVGGVEECVYRRTSCNHGLLARSSSDSDLAVVTAGYPGSLDVEAYEDEEEEEEDGDDSEDDRDDDDDCMGAEHNQQEELPYPGFVSISMKYLDQKSRPRNWCLAMITNPWFERASMLVILLNCVTLGMYQPCVDDQCISRRCRILQVFDDFIFAFFSLEMIVKMIAMGAYGPCTYLADSWNRLDFFIVIAGALEYCLNVENINFSAIRTIRVLRPLRAINRIPSMRILVMLLLDTLPMLGNVLLLCFFVFFIFGIIGVQLWEGILRQRCFLKPLPNVTYPKMLPAYYTLNDEEKDYICSKNDDNGMHSCFDLPPTRGHDALICNATATMALANGSCVNWNYYYTECKSQGENPFQGTISFDNIGLAWVAIFVVISLEGWVDIMYYVQDAHSFWDWIYFVLLIVIGSFFMINLCLVVIATQFSETKKREMERMKMERARFHSTSTLTSSTNNSEPSSCYAQMVNLLKPSRTMFTTNLWINIITPCTIIVTVAYYFCVSTFKKWEKLNVPYIKPIPLFGNFLNVALGKEHQLEFYNKIYYKFAGHKYGGLYQMRLPLLMVRDPEIINDVLIKDFSSFPDRGFYSDFEANPLSNNLFFMENPQWKTIRNKLTPAFTSGKLKTMYNQIKKCGDALMKNIDSKLNENNNEIEIRDIMGKFSTDVIGTCVFGLKLNAINDDESPFRKYGKLIFTPSLRMLFRELCVLISPALLKFIRVKDFPRDATDFFHAAFKETITYRLENKIVRNDLVDCLMQARNELVLNKDLPKHEKFTESQIVANAFVMFAAGFETVSTTVSYCLYELALNKTIQDKVRQEIQLKLSKNDGQINHEFLMDLNYLDMVIAETLRMYPPLVFLLRKASQPYRLPNDSLIVEKGQKIVIPVYAMHHDSKYYTEPEKFIPERFSYEEKAKRPNGIYLPFGDGPRICIGKRFAEMEMKLALVEMLTKFEVFPCEKTEIPLKYFNKVFTLIPKHGIWLTFKKIN